MNKIKYLMLAATMLLGSFAFTSCSDDDENENNYTKYQNAVDAQIKAGKKHNKAILLVAFGSTWQQAFNAFDTTKAAYEQEFKDYDIYVSYSSAICINRAAAGEHKAEGADVRNYYAPNFWLHGFGAAKYDEIVVQSLQVIPGEEFTRVVNYMKDFMNNSLGDLDDKYLSQVSLKLGAPLLTDVNVDVPAVAKALDSVYASYARQGVVAFMGHGNPNSYDTYSANIRFTQLEEALQQINDNYFVGTVDMSENFKTHVLGRMKEAGKTSGKVFLHPLMSIAGDHAHNDMGGDDGEDMKPAEYEYNEEGEIEDLSWKCYFSQNGYTCSNETVLMYGLLEVPSVRQIWMRHTREAVNGDALDDYYHSMFPEE
ncbi:MAG: sirohydrochlorin cobaltochelatase [Bacteroidaceae bacterium]|nr:sirohydrochlorin cobaltochelatase [Bacteroidaceae bacterium]